MRLPAGIGAAPAPGGRGWELRALPSFTRVAAQCLPHPPPLSLLLLVPQEGPAPRARASTSGCDVRGGDSAFGRAARPRWAGPRRRRGPAEPSVITRTGLGLWVLACRPPGACRSRIQWCGGERVAGRGQGQNLGRLGEEGGKAGLRRFPTWT
jgi:hypothetical protein